MQPWAVDLTAHAIECLELSSHSNTSALSCLTLRFSAGEKSNYAFIVLFTFVQKRNLNRTNVFFLFFFVNIIIIKIFIYLAALDLRGSMHDL